MSDPIRILIIDEHPDEQAATVRALARDFADAQFLTISQAQEFTALLGGQRGLDLVITEHDLSWSNGLAVLKAIRSYWPDCPVVMLTHAPSAEIGVQGMKAGLTDFLSKGPQQLARLPMVVRSALKQARKRSVAKEVESRYQNLFNNMPVGLFVVSQTGRFLDVNPAIIEVLGYESREELLGADLLDMFVDRDERVRWLQLMELEGVVSHHELKLRRRDNVIIWAEINAMAVYGADRRVTHFEGSLENITERKWTEERLGILAHHDALTGLPNRLLFNQRLQQALQDATAHEFLVAVVFLDLDRFKYINDTLGHDTGDVVLKAVAARLSASLREGNTVARLSGDEFGVILTDISHIEDVTKTAENVLQIFSQPFYVPNRELFITPSMGITVFPFDESDPEGLVKNAEVAMYGAKAQGRNNFQYYSIDMTARVSRHLVMEHALRRALERSEFQLHYQPQVHVESGRIVGIEALIRWHNPRSTLVPPSEFIPLAEETGLILPIGEWALHAACLQNKAWQDAGLPHMRVAVNLSARQFQHPGLLQMIRRVLEDTGLEASSLELEITESVLMQNTQSTIVTLNEVSRMGVHLSVDDFGTGYSSLSYLKRFPLNSLKIDQSFVRDVNTDPDNAAIVTAIIAMAHGLGLSVIAEGVETSEQLAFLRAQRSEMVQGYFVSKPLHATALAEMLHGRQLAHH